MAACNPFNVITKNDENDNELECKFEHEDDRNMRLSHRVNPLKTSILNYVWDFGALTEENEKEYIKRMLKGEERQIDILKEVVYISHFYIKDEVEKNKSSVSLRDIKRVNHIYNFWKEMKKKIKRGRSTDKRSQDDDFYEVVCVTVAINYLFRLHNQGKFVLVFNTQITGRLYYVKYMRN
jgi:hypothetical protein